MSRLILVLLIVIACILLFFAACRTASETKPLEAALPAPGFGEGWYTDGQAHYYDADTLYDHINGEAELYFPYGFTAAVTTTYVFREDPGQSVSADVYQMGSLLDAFGIYSNYRYPDSQLVQLGGEGFRDVYQLMFFQDRYFVRLSLIGDRQHTGGPLLACGHAIAAALPGEPVKPAELDLLQIDGVARQTEQYVAESLLGYAFFPRGLLAKATIDGEPVRVFVVLTDSPEAAAQALAAYGAYLEENGAEFQRGQVEAGACITAQDPLHNGLIVQQAGRHLLGAVDLKEPADGAPLVERLLARTARHPLTRSLNGRKEMTSEADVER